VKTSSSATHLFQKRTRTPTLSFRSHTLQLFVFTILFLLSGCDRRPTVTPDKVQYTSVDPSGVRLKMHVLVTNNSSTDVEIKWIRAKVWVARVRLAPLSMNQRTSAPGNKTIEFDVHLHIPTHKIPAIIGTYPFSANIQYRVLATAKIDPGIFKQSSLMEPSRKQC
jgi:LEA14-like dessication related protein